MKVIPSLSALLVISLALPSISNSQSVTATAELPVCNAVASDADGDGFGWELQVASRWNGEYGSCRVTEESNPEPVVIHRGNGARISLSRAFWDASDIAGRKIRCEYFLHNQSTSTYERSNWEIRDREYWQYRDTLYFHEPLSRDLPRMSTMFRYAVDELPVGVSVTDIEPSDPLWEVGLYGFVPLWTINDGIYQGGSPLGFSPYVEIFDHGAGTANAVRIWAEDDEPAVSAAADYFACYALDGAPLVPTGAPESSVDSYITLDDSATVSMTTNTPTSDDYINQETGQLVEFTDGVWNYNQQIAMHHFSCHQNEWEWRESSVFGPIDLDDSLAGWNTIFHPYTGGDSVLISRRSYTSRDRQAGTWQTKRVSIVSGTLGQWTTFDSRFSGWEQTDAGFRLWDIADNNSFYECSVGLLTQLSVANLSTWTNAYARDVSFAPQSVVEPPVITDTTEPTATTDTTGTTEPTSTTDTTDTTQTIDTENQSSGGGSLNLFFLTWLFLLTGVIRMHRSVGKESDSTRKI